MIYEAVSRNTGRVIVAFDAADATRAAGRLNFELSDLGWLPEWARQLIPQSNRLKLRRAPDPGAYPHITTARFDWLPKGSVHVQNPPSAPLP